MNEVANKRQKESIWKWNGSTADKTKEANKCVRRWIDDGCVTIWFICRSDCSLSKIYCAFGIWYLHVDSSTSWSLTYRANFDKRFYHHPSGPCNPPCCCIKCIDWLQAFIIHQKSLDLLMISFPPDPSIHIHLTHSFNPSIKPPRSSFTATYVHTYIPV